MLELKPDVKIRLERENVIQIHLLVQMLGELHALRLQMNELLNASHDPENAKRIAMHYEGMCENCVDQTKREIEVNFS